MLMSADGADLCQRWLNANGVRACATPTPHDLGDGCPLPVTVCVNTGGTRADLVVDTLRVDLETHAATLDAAASECRRACAVACEMAGADGLGATVYAASPVTLPYEWPDADHPDLAMATCTVQITVRAREE